MFLKYRIVKASYKIIVKVACDTLALAFNRRQGKCQGSRPLKIERLIHHHPYVAN